MHLTLLSNFYPTKLAGDLSYKHVFTSRVENSVDPDQLASQKPADQDLHCFRNGIYPGLAWSGLSSKYHDIYSSLCSKI